MAWRGGTPASAGSQQRRDGCRAVQGEVAQGRRRVVSPPAMQDQRQHDVAAGRAVGWRPAAACQVGVLLKGLVAALMVLRFYRPVTATPGQRLLRPRLCAGHQGDAVGLCDAGGVGLEVGALPAHAEHLCDVRIVDRLGQQRQHFELAAVDAPMGLLLLDDA